MNLYPQYYFQSPKPVMDACDFDYLPDTKSLDQIHSMSCARELLKIEECEERERGFLGITIMNGIGRKSGLQ